MPRIGRMLCRVGLHWMESTPSDLDAIRLTGQHHLFSSIGLQLGNCQCLRRGCKATRTKFRVVQVGFGGPLSPSSKSRWKRLDNRTRERIKTLPPLTV